MWEQLPELFVALRVGGSDCAVQMAQNTATRPANVSVPAAGLFADKFTLPVLPPALGSARMCFHTANGLQETPSFRKNLQHGEMVIFQPAYKNSLIL